MEFNVGNLDEIISSSFIFFWAMNLVLFWCECGKMVNTQFALFDHELWQCSWYLFPNDMQQMLAFVMANTQDPAVLLGFGNIECTRDTFKRVICLFISIRSFS